MIEKKYHCWALLLLINLLIAEGGVFAQHGMEGVNPLSNVSLNLPADSVYLESDSLLIPSDSLTLTLDSIPSDSVMPQKKSNAIDAPVIYSSKDSMVMVMDGHNMIYLYGDASVQYQEMNLDAEYIEVDADSSIVYSSFGVDSIGSEFGFPVFKDGDTSYEMRKARYNFKTKKMFITDVITRQGEGLVTAGETKKMTNDDMFMVDGRYTTCDDPHPHFYLQLTKAKVQPGKRIVTGPAYLVVEDVPLPIAIPFGFFPFKSDYSSGVLMPTYGDEMTRGFSLRDGGYYFAFNDYVDLALTGEVFTKGSWGVNARSSYRKRYKFSGNLETNYRVTVTELPNSTEKIKDKDFMIRWAHSQDAKANPFSTFSASVDFSTSSYSRNDVTSIYSNRYTDNVKRSAVNYGYRPPNSPFSFNMNASINQATRDTTLSITFPNLTISMRDIYPFRRKDMVGTPKWYENIRLSYNGSLSNSISGKEYDVLHKNVIKDWKNGMQHNIPISLTFNVLKSIAVTASVNYKERWYTSSIEQVHDPISNRTIPVDTTYGFYRLYDYSVNLQANTKLYGMYKPWRLFGEWTKRTQIRHVMTPSVSFSGAPDFGDEKYGYYRKINYLGSDGTIEEDYYSPFSHHIYGLPSRGRTGNLGFSLDNNLEMKIPMADSDSTRKISLVDQLRLSSGYNFLADSLNWNNIRANLRLKFGSVYTLSLQGEFDVYLYNEKGRRMNKTRLSAGKGLGRLISTGTTFSYSINNSTLQKLFFRKKTETSQDETPVDTEGEIEQADAIAVEDAVDRGHRPSLRRTDKQEDNYDSDGYYDSSIPWNINFSYSLSVGYDRSNFDKVKREYPYAITQALGVGGSITPTKGWTFNFNTNFDFEVKKFVTMQCSITRQMHCWQMSASVIPIGPYQSYHFTIAVSSSLLQDLKYNQSSSYRDAKKWGE